MKLPDDTLIAHEKLTQYLLALRKRNDKSQWLAQAGYTIQNSLPCILTKGDRKMTYKLFEEVVLTKDIHKRGLKKGDVATIVEHHPVSDKKDGYSLELFNALGDTIAVITLPESAIEPLTENEIFSVRLLAAA